MFGRRCRLHITSVRAKILTIYIFIYTNIVVHNINMLYVQLPPYLVFAQPRYYVRQKRTEMLGNPDRLKSSSLNFIVQMLKVSLVVVGNTIKTIIMVGEPGLRF